MNFTSPFPADSEEFAKLLKIANLPSVETAADGFIVKDRIEGCSKFLKDAGWNLQFEDKQAFVFSPEPGVTPSIIISAHADTVFQPEDHFVKREIDGWLGQWDNAICIASLMSLTKDFPNDGSVVIALTGGEERLTCEGVHQIAAAYDMSTIRAIALDVTYSKGVAFENFNSLPELGPEFDNIIRDPRGMPDEGYFWQRHTPYATSICIPVQGNMHGASGCTVQDKDIELYRGCLKDVIAPMLAQLPPGISM